MVPEPRLRARYWDEDTVVEFHQKKYRVLSRLGSGGVGSTFKVIHIDGITGEEFGTYVGKVIFEKRCGRKGPASLLEGEQSYNESALGDVARDVFVLGREYLCSPS